MICPYCGGIGFKCLFDEPKKCKHCDGKGYISSIKIDNKVMKVDYEDINRIITSLVETDEEMVKQWIHKNICCFCPNINKEKHDR